MEQDLTGKAPVLRLDVMSSLGRQTAASYGVRGVPALIVVDGQGLPVLTQFSLIRPAAVKDQVDQLLSQAD